MPRIDPKNQPAPPPARRRKKRGDSVRLFIAIYPPLEIAEAMSRALERFDALPSYRRTPVEQIHLTLHFLGNVLEKRIQRVQTSVERAAKGIGAMTLTPDTLIRLPERGRARLLALRTDVPPGLYELRSRLVTKLASHARPRPNDRFTPHLTLCRFRSPSRVSIPESREQIDSIPGFDVREVHLMRSVLVPTGAEHRIMARIPLSESD